MSDGALRILVATSDPTFGNSGDALIFHAIISMIREELSDVILTTLSETPAKTGEQFGVRAVPAGTTACGILRNLPGVLREIARCDLVVWGGGNIIQDASSVLYTPYHMTKLLLMRCLGKRVFAWAVGVGPISRYATRVLVRNLGRLVDQYSVRDAPAGELLVQLGIDPRRVTVVADPALFLRADEKPPDWEQSLDGGGALPEAAGWVAFAPRRLFMRTAGFLPMTVKVALARSSGAYGKQRRWEASMAEWADHVHEKHGLGVLFIPMSCARGQRDDLICQQIMGRMRSRQRARMLKPDLAVDELLRVYRSLDMVVGVRYHSVLLSLATGRPFVAMNYTMKGESLTERLGCREWSLPAEEATAARLIGVFDRAWRRREELAAFSRRQRERLRPVVLQARDLFGDFVAAGGRRRAPTRTGAGG